MLEKRPLARLVGLLILAFLGPAFLYGGIQDFDIVRILVGLVLIVLVLWWVRDRFISS